MRDPPRAELFASRAIASCEEGGFDFYGGLAQVIHGWAISFGPNRAAAIAEVSRGIEQVRAPEADICLSCFLPWLAEVHLLVGNVDEGLATMREAHELAEETFYAAERLRVEADLRAAVDLAGAAACYAQGAGDRTASREHCIRVKNDAQHVQKWPLRRFRTFSPSWSGWSARARIMT